jgi:starch phosphorylase
MHKQTPVCKPLYNLLPKDIEGLDCLTELALDMCWSWNHATDEVWRHLDPVLWELTHHPWDVLQTVSRQKIQDVMAEPAFRKRVNDLALSKKRAGKKSAWFQQNHPETPLADASGVYVYKAAAPADRPPTDYTARLIPHCDGVAIPLEEARIMWQP